MAPKRKNQVVPEEKDDGTRWVVIDLDGNIVYPTKTGSTKAQATRLATGLVQPAKIVEITPS
jgi:hypothetical protein